jgi:hypothetical protein
MSVEVVMSLGIVTGIADRAAAFVMAGYCIVTALLWKQFWKIPDFRLKGASHGRDTFWDFLKNLALAGGFLMLTFGPNASGVKTFIEHPLSSTQPYHVSRTAESRPARDHFSDACRATGLFGVNSSDADRLAEFYCRAFDCTIEHRQRHSRTAFERLTGCSRRRPVLATAPGESHSRHTSSLMSLVDPTGSDFGASDSDFQHFAIVVADMDDAFERLRQVSGWTPHSRPPGRSCCRQVREACMPSSFEIRMGIHWNC